MSLTQIRNSNGPKTDPCGTPHVILSLDDKQFLKKNNKHLRGDLLPNVNFHNYFNKENSLNSIM